VQVTQKSLSKVPQGVILTRTKHANPERNAYLSGLAVLSIPPRGVEETPYHAGKPRADDHGDTISDTGDPPRPCLVDSTPKTVMEGLPDAVRDQLQNLSPDMATTIRQLLAAVESEQRCP
jgi:hypothetical protein